MQDPLSLPGDAADSLSSLGRDPSRPLYDLNLAGVDGVPSPQMLATPNSMPTVLLPDFGTQDYDIPTMKPYDLTGPGITYMPEFAADPALPDLEAYAHPYGLDLSSQNMDADPQLAHDVPTAEEIASSLYSGLGFSDLTVQHDVTDPDPLVPDLQSLDLTQHMQMPANERPGNLDPSALTIMHATPSYQQTADTTYPEAWMNQGGMNTARSRHMSLLNDGLER
jgi:hypothetical protein